MKHIIWDLSSLYKNNNDPNLKHDINKIKALIRKLNQSREIFKDSQKLRRDLFKVLQDYEILLKLSLNLYAFWHLQYDLDSAQTDIKANLEKVKKIWVDNAAELAWLEVGLSKIGQSDYKWLIKQPKYKPYVHYLKINHDSAKYTLSEAEERILSICSLGGSMAWETFYNLYSTSLDFGKIKVNGKNQVANESLLINLSQSPKRNLRRQAFEQGRKAYADRIDHFAHIYNSVVSDYNQRTVKLRKYKSSLDRRAKDEETSTKQIDLMLKVLNKNTKIFQDFYKFKQKTTGIKDFSSYDLYAPIYNIQENVDLKQGCRDLISCLQGFDPEIKDLSQKFISNKWIHTKVLPRKQSGAYCFPTQPHAYVLMNYQNTYNDVFTLAHELGHAAHFWLAEKTQTHLQAGMSLLIAETASQFNELLLLDYYLEQLPDKKVRNNLLARQLDDRLNALFRQSMITEFEIKAHQVSQNQGLTADWLNQQWLDLTKQRNGRVIKNNYYEQYGWARIPHIFQSPLYCYTYTMSMFIILALYNKYQDNKSGFVSGYKDLLSAGQSDSPERLLKKYVGLNMNKSDFYEEGLTVIKKMIKKLQ